MFANAKTGWQKSPTRLKILLAENNQQLSTTAQGHDVKVGEPVNSAD